MCTKGAPTSPPPPRPVKGRLNGSKEKLHGAAVHLTAPLLILLHQLLLLNLLLLLLRHHLLRVGSLRCHLTHWRLLHLHLFLLFFLVLYVSLLHFLFLRCGGQGPLLLAAAGFEEMGVDQHLPKTTLVDDSTAHLLSAQEEPQQILLATSCCVFTCKKCIMCIRMVTSWLYLVCTEQKHYKELLATTTSIFNVVHVES